MTSDMPQIHLRAHSRRLCQILALVGAATLVAGLFLAPDRTWGNMLVVSFALVSLGLGGAIFLAIHTLAGAGWATALRRIPEAMFMLLPIGGAGILLILLLRPELYPWTDPGPELQHFMVGFKGQWLNRPFFLARAAGYLVVWIFLARKILSHSRQQDQDGKIEHTILSGRYSAIFTVIFALTFCLASFDWIMSLEPEWFSTIFGLYNFAGMFVAALALMTILAIWLSRRGDLRGILGGEHLHDLGKLMMGFSAVWAYLWFSQYMLIWYSNLPEETGYFVLRRSEAWNSLFFLNLILNWALPFCILLPASAKRSTSVMAKVAGLLLAGRWLDLYLMVMPPIAGSQGPYFGLWEIGFLVGVAGLVPLVVVRSLRAAPLLAINDPRYQQSLHYHS